MTTYAEPNRAAVPRDVLDRLRRVRLLGLDVDGVMTDGRLHYGVDAAEVKSFHAQDGSAMKRLMASSVAIAIITGRESAAVDRRAGELGVRYLYAGVADKLDALDDLSVQSGVPADQMAYAGDDVPDLGLFERVAVSFSVPNAHPAVLARADYVTSLNGGFGAVREICDLIVAARQRTPG